MSAFCSLPSPLCLLPSTPISSPPVSLTIAGSDSGGGAGIQADLKTFHQLGVYGTSVITAITAQNTLGVRRWEAVKPSMVRAQLEAVLDDLRPGATKSGMLADATVVRAVATVLRGRGVHPYVLDPVMVASSGDRLLEESAVAIIRQELLPLADLVTPNLDEAEILTGAPTRDVAAMEEAARALVRAGARAALVKGGHLAGGDPVDVLWNGETMRRFTHRRIHTSSTHGTGCTLSAAISALLARGNSLESAVEGALDFVHAAIASAPRLGTGRGPVNHFAEWPGIKSQ